MRLEKYSFERDQEILRAKFTLLQALPELNTPENDPFVDILIVPGHLDRKIFETACLKVKICLNNTCDREEETRSKERAILEAEYLYNEGRRKISDGVWQLYITGMDHGEDDLVEVEMQDLLDIKEKYDEEIYNAIKIAWIEAQERRRTGVQLKPWDYEAGREKTLTELLVLLQARIQFLRNNIH